MPETVIDAAQLAENGAEEDLLWRQLMSLPSFRALLRAVEARFYTQLEFPQPVLDLGCGDGDFGQVALPGTIAAGIDPWWGPLHKAKRTGHYQALAQALGDRLPFADNYFVSAFSNSVLEHIPDIQPVLNEVGRVVATDGIFLITTPSHYFTEYLAGAQFFERMRFKSAADWYRRFFNKISRHSHTDRPEIWAGRLAEAGFRIERWQYYFSQEALHALELGHVQGLPSAVLHALTGHWILAPWKENLRPTEQWLRPFFEEPSAADGAYLLFICRKTAGNVPAPYHLPAPRPFNLRIGQ